jgi:asparagine synthase (glutamine-hydrolysing)
MCAINGIFSFNPAAGPVDRAELLATRDHMHARGPDGQGEWSSADRSVGLGHRRLAILDLSERASQPMVSACGRYVVVFNGEIYNYPELRRDLEGRGVVFRTRTDTEVLLHLYADRGEAMVEDLRGMFSFALWDDASRRLFLARDPYGIKPLYFANDGWTFRFASQVKALLAGGAIPVDPDPAGLVGFHLWGSVPEPFTLWHEIRALPAGCWQVIDAAGPREPVTYASIGADFAAGADQPLASLAPDRIIAEAVRDSVRAHLLADVEIGLFLSSGVDSVALLGLMRDAGRERVRALTLTFSEFSGSSEDEAPLAAEAAAYYGAEHVVRNVDEAELCADLPHILAAMDQPSIDGVNTWFVAKAARECGLKVALSGLGGDEILAGYPSFADIPAWVAKLRGPAMVPGAGRFARQLLRRFGAFPARPKAPAMLEYGGTYPGAYLLRRGLFLPYELDTLLDPVVVEQGLDRLRPLVRLQASMEPMARHPMTRVAVLESANYLRNQLLRDADWAGMAHGVEIRTPMVDRDLLRRIAPVVPILGDGAGKRALAAAPLRPVPTAVVERTKTGFVVPIEHWGTLTGGRTVANKGLAARACALSVLDAFACSETPECLADEPAIRVAAA